MFRLALTPLLFAVMTQGPPPLVPEGIHSDAKGPPELCGYRGRDLSELTRQILEDPDFKEEGSTTEYRVFNNDSALVQMVFPQSGTLEFPMATCRKVFTNLDGGTSFNREMHCEGTRDDCDRIFLQFEALDKKVTREIRGDH
jgi:hypothetical protein